MLAIGRMIGQAENFDRRAIELGFGACAGQDRLHLALVAQPVLDRNGLRVVGRVDVDVGRQAAIEPAHKRPAEGFHHGADADIDCQRQQQCHQRQRQSRQLLTAVGPEPCRKRTLCQTLAEMKRQFKQGGQDQCGAQKQCGEHRKSSQQGITIAQQQRGHDEHAECKRALQHQPAVLRLLPGLRLGGGEYRQPDRLGKTGRGGGERAEHADGDAGDPPFDPERQLARDLRPVKPAQGSRDIGQQRRGDEVAADEAYQPGDQRQRHQFGHQHRVEHHRRYAAGTQRP